MCFAKLSEQLTCTWQISHLSIDFLDSQGGTTFEFLEHLVTLFWFKTLEPTKGSLETLGKLKGSSLLQ
jgi:hypothetical protein